MYENRIKVSAIRPILSVMLFVVNGKLVTMMRRLVVELLIRAEMKIVG